MTWPNERLTTYTPGKPVKPADLNELQDAVIAARHGLVTAQIGIEAAVGHASTSDLAIVQLNPSFMWHIPRLIGDRVYRVHVNVRDRAGASIQARVHRFDPTAGSSQPIGTEHTSDASGTYQVITLADFGPLTITSRRRLFVELLAAGGPHTFTTMEVEFDRV